MKLLRHLIPLVIFCCLFGTTYAQYVTIPDTNFVSWLQAEYPTCMNGNQMDTTCADITTANRLDIYHHPITDLTGIQYFNNLGILRCADCVNPYIPYFPQSITMLYLDFNELTSLPPLPPALINLVIHQNALTSLPALPSTLQMLRCDDNPLMSLPSLPAGLQQLYCSRDSLTALPVLPAALTTLICQYNQLTVLPALPAGLQSLTCSNNPISVLPSLNNALTYLYCGSPQLTGLPALPATLTSLNCSEGNFATVPVLPPLLLTLYLYKIPISALPTLPSALSDLSVMQSQISTLPTLPSSLIQLRCSNNQLTSLPSLPPNLNSIDCSNNLLTSLPELPDSLEELRCSSNPNLRCLPKIKYIESLYFDQTGINCLSNYGDIRYSSPQLNTIPLCDPLNVNNCAVYWNISGNVYNDTSGNCLQQNGESNMAQIKVKLLQNGTVLQQAYTSTLGAYAFETPPGDYAVTVDTAGIPVDILCPATRFDSITITLLDSTAGGHNFAMECKPGFDVGVNSVSASGTTRPAAFNTVRVSAMDMARLFGETCNTANLSGQLVLTFTGPATYVSPAPNALSPVVSGNTLTYTVNDWSAVAANAFNFIIQVDTFAQAGQQICFDATVTPTAGDNNVSNNQLIYCVAVVNSYDPNDKAVYPINNVDITGDHWLTYTVRFQNTGNAPAEHIYITDTIDTDVNIETFQLLAYSFQPQVMIKGNAVRFNFANINLPDSVNDEPNSHGYVQYKVKIKDNATVGTVINNTAFIYFDFNAPVVTNTTTNTLTLPNGISTVNNSNATMQLYPNPAQDIVMINLSDNLTGGTLTLSDVTGRSLNAISNTSTHNQLNTGALSSGVYLVTAVKEGVRVVQRLVVSK